MVYMGGNPREPWWEGEVKRGEKGAEQGRCPKARRTSGRHSSTGPEWAAPKVLVALSSTGSLGLWRSPWGQRCGASVSGHQKKQVWALNCQGHSQRQLQHACLGQSAWPVGQGDGPVEMWAAPRLPL